jgi:SAM-dependent methyltransferase
MSEASDPPAINDRGFVQTEYADDTRLAARAAFWQGRSDPQPQEIALQKILELAPTAVLEVGCGQGQFAAELQAAGIDAMAVDQSKRMVELTARRGVRSQVADVQALPFPGQSFDLVAANYMLYHVPELSRGLSEIARVLRPGGVLIAVTNSERKLREMWDLVGRPAGTGEDAFCSENGASLLAPHFASIAQHDVRQRFRVTETAVRDYIRATRFAPLADQLPDLPDGLLVTAAGSVFIAATTAYSQPGKVARPPD